MTRDIFVRQLTEEGSCFVKHNPAPSLWQINGCVEAPVGALVLYNLLSSSCLKKLTWSDNAPVMTTKVSSFSLKVLSLN